MATNASMPAPPPTNNLSDIFSDSPPASPSSTTPQHSSEPSDIPRLRRIHVTNGYREGISWSKDQALQPGFDEAYPLGAILGLRVGYLLGMLEGLCSAHRSGKPQANGDDEKAEERMDGMRAEGSRIRELWSQAREELRIENLFGKEYWGSSGMWAYQVEAKEEDTTFWEVADQHPLVRKWLGTVRDEVRKAGIRNAEEGFVGIGETGGGEARMGNLQVGGET